MTNAEKYYLLLADYSPIKYQCYRIYEDKEEAMNALKRSKEAWQEVKLVKGVEIND